MPENVDYQPKPKKKQGGKGKPFVKGWAGPGRPKGVQNKMTVEVKAVLEKAFQEIGGVDALVAWGKVHQTEFYQLWGKLLPKNLEVSGGLSVRWSELVQKSSAERSIEE